MGKKLTAIIPLYLATLILLAFSVFPHHHHDSFICFNTIHKLSAENPQHHSHPEIPEKECHIQYLFQTDNVKIVSRHLSQEEDTFPSFAFFCYILTESLSLSRPAHTTDFLPDATDETFRQSLFYSHKVTRGPPCLG